MMGRTEFRLTDANITVIGSFNPAILRPEFLCQVCNLNDLGPALEKSPPEIPTISHIKYPETWWTVELNRMTVRALQLSVDLPGFVYAYLGALPYTPLFAAGVNLFADAKTDYDSISNCRLFRSASIFEVLGRFEAKEIDFVVKSRLTGATSAVPTEVTLSYTIPNNIRVLLQVGLIDAPTVVHAQYNWEVRDLDIDRSRFQLIGDRYSQIHSDFSALLADLLNNEEGGDKEEK